MPANGADHCDTESLPPSCRCVLIVLEWESPLTRQDIQARTGLPERTLSRALDTLQNGGYITKTQKSNDLRQVMVTLATERTLNTPESDR